jgi:hypothetical protein
MMTSVIITIVITTAWIVIVGWFIFPGPLIRQRRRWFQGTLSARKATDKLEAEITAALEKPEKRKE